MKAAFCTLLGYIGDSGKSQGWRTKQANKNLYLTACSTGHPKASTHCVHALSLPGESVWSWATEMVTLWHICWKAELWSQQKQPLLANSSANTPVVRQWLGSHHNGCNRRARNNRRAVGSSVFCVVCAKAIQRGLAAITTSQLRESLQADDKLTSQ